MGKFVYKYGSIKKVKEALEKKAQKEVFLVEAEINRCKQEIEEFYKNLHEQKEKVFNKRNLTSAELKFISNYEKFINEKIEKKEFEIDNLMVKREQKLRDLQEKSKDLKVFNKLEEKEYENFIIEQNRLEQIEIDDIATKKFMRQG